MKIKSTLKSNFVRLLLTTLMLSVCGLNVASAQSNASEEQLQQAKAAGQSQRADLSNYIQRSSNRLDNPTSDISYRTKHRVNTSTEPYGASLFEGGIDSARTDGINPDYLVVPGDKIAVQLWGAVELAEVFTVDNQGNIFIPQIGPVTLENIAAKDVNTVVSTKVKSVYTNNVNIYVNLLNATPISIFVSGPVLRPGMYAGLSAESLLYYLKRAGGIDPVRGSYRRIQILRDNLPVKEYDLYDFLRDGKLAAFSFKDNDVILVAEQGPVVTVEGAAKNPFRFELTELDSSGRDLMQYARPLMKTSHVAVNGNRTNGPFSIYVPLNQFLDFSVADGDVVLFNDDLRAQVISVQISGSYIGPSFYSIDKDVRLHELLEHIEVDPQLADIDSIYIKRQSVIKQQKHLLELSLQRLERSIFTAPASSDGESQIRAQEAELVMNFVERARSVEPLGKVVLSADGKVANVRLEQGDEIIIPAKTDLIQISGEVMLPQAIVFNEQAGIADYVKWSGGFSERANDEKVAIVHANGLTTFVDIENGGFWYSTYEGYQIKPGDQILVMPKVDTKLLQAVKDITQIIYQVAVAANVAKL